MDLVPEHLHRRQKDRRKNGPRNSAADQGVGERAPEHGMGPRNNGQDCRQGVQDHRPGALHSRFHKGVEWIKPRPDKDCQTGDG